MNNDNVIQFPNGQITVEDTLANVAEVVKTGRVRHMMVIMIEDDTHTNMAMSTIPAYWAVYMTWFADKKVQNLMRDAGLIT